MSTLSSNWWHEVSPYLEHALTLAAEDRTLWLASLRQQNPLLAARLQMLLNEHHVLAEERFLERPPVEFPDRQTRAGEAIGAYSLVSRIGQGGMGSVWLAERSDGRFERRAAIKFLSIALAGRASEQRFKREGSILGRLTHPNIAQLIDAGVSADGQPYLVLEYVEGEHIDRYCERGMLDVEARVRLFVDVLGAVAHAHTNLVVHRDIKPSNVLVRTDGEVKLLDFGIAKLLEDDGTAGTATLLTREGGMALTPEYAAPEQLTGEPVTTATDVYALGVLFYVLLTGQHPAGSSLRSPADLIKAVVDTEPPPLSQAVARKKTTESLDNTTAALRGTTPEKLERALRGDLETIAAKALKKSPHERYTSVAAFADDLRRYLRHQPISARPDRFAYRAGKFIRRNRAVVALATLAGMASAAGLIGTVTQARTARAQRDFALRQLSRAEAAGDLDSFLLSDAVPSGKSFTTDDLLLHAQHIVERQATGDRNRPELLISIGRQYTAQDEYGKARPLLEEAYRLSRALPDPSTRARASCGLAQALSRVGEPKRAEDLFQEAMRTLPNEPIFAADRVSCLLRGSEVARNRGDTQGDISRAQAAQQALRGSPYQSDLLELDTQITLAGAYSDAARHHEADVAFEQAAARLAALGRDDTQMAGTVLNNWGVDLILAGRPLEAEKVLRRSIAISQNGGSEQSVSSQSLVNYARALHDLGRFNEAANYAERAYAKARQAGDEAPTSQSLSLLSSIYRNRGELERAGQMLSELEPRLHRNLPSGHIAFGSLALQRALNAEARGDRQSALQFADQAVSTAENLVKNRHHGGDYLALFLVQRSGIRLQFGDGNRAASDATSVLNLLRGSIQSGEFSSTAGHAYLTLGRTLNSQGKREEARAAFLSATEHFKDALGPDHPDTRAARQLANSPDFSRQ